MLGVMFVKFAPMMKEKCFLNFNEFELKFKDLQTFWKMKIECAIQTLSNREKNIFLKKNPILSESWDEIFKYFHSIAKGRKKFS